MLPLGRFHGMHQSTLSVLRFCQSFTILVVAGSTSECFITTTKESCNRILHCQVPGTESVAQLKILQLKARSFFRFFSPGTMRRSERQDRP